MVDSSESFPSKYLASTDLQGKQPKLKIDHVEQEVMRDGAKKLIIYFVGAKKGLVLNKTNWKVIVSEYGVNTDDWVGADVVLYTVMTEFNGETKEGLRIKLPKVERPKPVAKRPSVDEEIDEMDDGDKIPF